MDNFIVLILGGFIIGTLGTLIGAGGGFILVPVLLLAFPQLPPDVVTGISIAIVACNAISGSIAYARSGRIDFKAGLLFALFTIPGSILGVRVTKYISPQVFTIVFGIILIAVGIFLFLNKKNGAEKPSSDRRSRNWKHHELIDNKGEKYSYSYNQTIGIFISIFVGFISPVLGIGGGIVHVPAMVQWLQFPVHIATATSHFILAIMSIISVVTHYLQGSYNDPAVVKMIIYLAIGVVAGAQLGAFLSHKIKGTTIIKALAVCLTIVGVRLLLQHL
jgi:uncharacterized membrane protein YfcA